MRHTRPIVFFVLILPYGMSSGAATILLPFLLTRAGFSVAVTASVVAIGLIPNVTRSLLAPIIDVSLTLHRWYLISLVICAATVLLLTLVPIRQDTLPLIIAAAFLSQVGGNLQAVPVGGFMALTVAEQQKGRAGGWYQAGNLGGAGLGGGAGVWLATHLSTPMAGAFLCGAMMLAALSLRFVPPVPRTASGAPVRSRFRSIASDLVALVGSPTMLLVTVMVLSPIGIGAATNLWSAIAPDWRASADRVAFTTGVINGLASAAGCVAGGWCADRVGRWTAFFGAGLLMAAVAMAMELASRTPMMFSAGVLGYAFSQGVANAAFTALALYATGRGTAAATKYALLGSLGNIPVSYMTAFDGFAHDRWGAGGMLNAESWLGVAAVGLGLFALWKIRRASPTINAEAAERAEAIE